MTMSRDDMLDLFAIITATTNRDFTEVDIDVWQRILGNITADEAAVAVLDHFRDTAGIWLEPGHIVARVRAARRDAYERQDPNYRDADKIEAMFGDDAPRRDRTGRIDKSAPDDDDYPPEWTPEQRLKAYWAKIQARRDEAEYAAAIAHPGSLLLAPPASHAVRAQAVQQFASRQLALDEADDALPYVNALLVRCPFCKSPAGDQCTQAGLPNRPKDKREAPHPGRIETAAREAGHPEDVVKAIVNAAVIRRTKQVRAGWPQELAFSAPIPNRPSGTETPSEAPRPAPDPSQAPTPASGAVAP